MTTEEFQKKYGIIGKSKELKDIIDITNQISTSDISVLIYGESGVGKEVFARAIHESSKRSRNKLVSVNCGAIPEGILESELFGHKKGSFTGAVDDRKGYFEIANSGTLFLDEIAEMPLTTQVKLLRVLETQEFMRIGSETVTKVDVRIIAATNKDLQREVDSKRFRKDLYFRLKAVTLNIPPLRTRTGDITMLAEHFIKRYSDENNIPQPKITSEAYDLLINYSWPGNIRELKNVIESAVALSKDGILTPDSFKSLLSFDTFFSENRNLPIPLNRTTESIEREMIFHALIDIKNDLKELKRIAARTEQEFENSVVNPSHIKEVVPIEKMERDAIYNALVFTKWNKRKAAKLLNMTERTFYRKLNEYDIH